jgi:hypothetical protein
MAKTRKRRIKQRGGASCLFVLDGIIDSIGVLINTVGKIKKKTDVEKINEIGSNFYTNIANVFDRQINTTCTDIKKSDYASLIKHLTTLSVKFQEKQEVFSDDTQGYLTRIETMKTRASELSELIIEPLPNPPQTKSKKPNPKIPVETMKTPSKVVETVNFMPPQPPTLPSVSAATTEERAAKEAKKNAEKKARRALREEEARKAEEEARKAEEEARKAEEEARKAEEEARKAEEESAKTIANELASKVANEAAKEEAIKVANEYIKIAAKNAEKKITIKATVKRLAEKDKKKAAEEAKINYSTKKNIEFFFEEFTKYQIEPLGIITQDQASKYVTTLFPNVKFTEKITNYQESASTQSDSENYMYYSYLYIMHIGILNNYLHFLTVNHQYDLFAGLKLIFKGGRAAQIMLPKGSNLLSDDTDIFIQSTNIEHSPFFLKTFAIQLAKSWTTSQQIIFGIGKKNPNIVKIAYKSLTGFIPISDIDFGSPTYPQYYDDIRMVDKTWKIISEPLIDEGKSATKASTTLATKLATMPVSKITFVYYHQSPKLFFAEKREIYDLYSNPFYKNCNCRDLLHTEECVASCSERQFYLDKFKKYVDVKTTPSSSNRKTQKNKSVSSV